MIFNRSSSFHSKLSAQQIREKLLGKHISLHKMDFEVMEKHNMLKIIPHAENATDVKTLPITHVSLNESSNGTKIKMKSHMRRIDAGGPILLFIFCLLAMLGGIGLYIKLNEKEALLPYALFGLGLLIFIIFWFRMERGYFFYIRKLHHYVKQQVQ